MKKYNTTVLSTPVTTFLLAHFTALGAFSEIAFALVVAFGIIVNI